MKTDVIKTDVIDYLDYYKLSSFFQCLLIENSGKELHYTKHILSTFSDILGYNKSVFWLLSQESNSYLPVSFHIDKQIFDMYTDQYYRYDPFIPDKTFGISVPDDVACISDLMSYQQFYTSRFYTKFLLKNNISYQAALYIKSNDAVVGIITLFRSKEEGDFTKSELHLLRKTVPYITKLTSNFYLDDKHKVKGHLYETICNQSPVGIIAFNAYYPYEIRYINSAAGRYVSELLTDKHTGNPVSFFIEKYIANTNFDEFGLYKLLVSRTSKSYNLSVLPCQTADENNLSAYAYIIPQKSMTEGQNFLHLHDYDFLSPRQIEIIKYVLQGYSNQEISNKMFISINTVKTHLNKIYKEFNVTSRLSLCSKLTIYTKKP